MSEHSRLFRSSLSQFQFALEDVPQLLPVIELLSDPENSSLRRIVLHDISLYLRLFRILQNLEVDSINLISKVENRLIQDVEHKTNSASSMRLATFKRKIKNKEWSQLLSNMLSALRLEGQQAEAGLEVLSERMNLGSQLAAADHVHMDGDELSDNSIYSHTMITPGLELSDRALINVALVHFFERFMAEHLRTQGIEIEKDSFINVITQIVILEGLSNEKFADLLDLWKTSKDQGGLGWASERRIAAYQAVLEQ